ncbi:protein tyrosine phosphatase type IVA 3 isoform X2 [Tachysurus fulvidraco]|uniref:protein tyrosine phosphatase type IVA 3 isoform X2 n=1 Tax=Tachysurus fulvidraco TaxID=1234273 RepID=UPI001FED6C2F|nr:protein tyrosine phosphatase type IVA 3 isoform X2 [Tachysurus fulvidraco]
MARMNRPAPVEVCYKNMRFLITHNPTNSTLNSFKEDLKKYGATTVVRVCEVTYDKTPLEKDGITVVDWPFDDGAPPPSKVVEDWLSLLRRRFMEEPGCCVAVHCVAGLGRSVSIRRRVGSKLGIEGYLKTSFFLLIGLRCWWLWLSLSVG